MAPEEKLSVVEAQAVEETFPGPSRSVGRGIEREPPRQLLAGRMEASGSHYGGFSRLLLHSGRERPIRQCGHGGVPSGKVVRSGTCPSLPRARFLHRRRHRRLCEPGRRNEIPGADCVQVDRLSGGFRVGNSPCGLLLHSLASFRGYLDSRSRLGAGFSVSLLRACH